MGIQQWIARARGYSETRRKKILYAVVGILFILVCGVWIGAVSMGYSDFGAQWISGTRTYVASGTTSVPDDSFSSIGTAWESARNRIGAEWNQLMNIFEETESSSTPISAPSTSTSFIPSDFLYTTSSLP